MNVKLEFVIELPEELRAAMSLNGETGLCSWIEGGELHVRIMDDPPEIDDAYDEGFSEGYGGNRTHRPCTKRCCFYPAKKTGS